MRSNGHLVAHRARHDKEGCLVLCAVRDILLQRVRRGVFVEDVVKKRGLCDRFEHGHGRLGHCVA